MNRFGYNVLGYTVWNGGKWYLRRRYGNAPRNVAIGSLLVIVLAALVFGGRKATTT
jgi:hypothetical protein